MYTFCIQVRRDRWLNPDKFEWDENKRKQVVEEHGIDMVYAAQIFDGDVLTRLDDRRDYGEVRLISLGIVDDECLSSCIQSEEA